MGRNSGGGGGSAGGGATEAGLPKAQARALLKEEAKIRNNDFETALVVDENGKVLLNKKGGDHEVEFTDADVAKMKGATITHNHPGDGPLSFDDIVIANLSGSKGIRAVGKNNTYSLTIEGGQRGRSRRDIANAYSYAKDQVGFNNHLASVESKFGRNSSQYSKAWNKKQEETISYMAHMLKWKYTTKSR